MIYSDLPAGAAVFVDASPFIHHFEPNALFGPAATEFLERVENQEITGFCTTHIISEVGHRLMTIEAMQTFGWKSAGIALKLRNHPAEVQKLKQFRKAIQEIPLFGIQILLIAILPGSTRQPPARTRIFRVRWSRIGAALSVPELYARPGVARIATDPFAIQTNFRGGELP
jgi:predicted nucleic acid-binding protein